MAGPTHAPDEPQGVDLRARERALDEELAHALAHDLRPGLHQMKTFAELIASDPDSQLSAKSTRQLNLIRDVCERTRARLDALRDYLKLGDQREQAALSGEELVASALQQLSALIDARGALVQVGALPSVRGARPQLELLFRHLLDNALKYAPAEGARVRVQGELRQERAWFEICDNGPGIAEGQRARACGLFQRLHAGEPAGLGTGLALCRRIVELAGGTLRLDTATGGGTSVTFSLPAASAPAT